jgi:hypothetical protein
MMILPYVNISALFKSEKEAQFRTENSKISIYSFIFNTQSTKSARLRDLSIGPSFSLVSDTEFKSKIYSNANIISPVLEATF